MSSFTSHKNPFTTNCVCEKPLIYQGRIISEEDIIQERGGLYTRVDVLTWELWEIQIGAIIEVILGYQDCNNHKKEPMGTLLDQW